MSGNNEDLFKDLQYPNLIKEEDLKFLEESANRPSLLSILQSIGIDENLANNLFTDFELNKNELEAMIKKDIEEKLLKSDNNTNINPIQNNNINKNSSNNTSNVNNINNINNNYQNINNIKDINNNQNNIKSINNTKKEDSSINYSFNLDNVVELRNHFDEVRKLSYLENINSFLNKYK